MESRRRTAEERVGRCPTRAAALHGPLSLALVAGVTACAPGAGDAEAAGSDARTVEAAQAEPSGTAGSGGPVASQEAPNTLTAEEREAGWRLLFDGETTEGWRGYMMDDVPDGWTVEEGTLTRSGRGRDIVTVERFSDFELSVEWRVEPGGNSGILYRVVEGPEQTYHSGPEMQVLDDARHPDGGSPLTSAGANYGLHPAPRGVVRPAGEWNQARILVDGNHVEHWLNGEKIVEYELASEDWERRVAASKFAEWPSYGRADEGHIALQDHGDRVWYRNVKIRVIE